MRIPKRYGQSKIAECPFCGKQAIAKNTQGLNVCQYHKDNNIPDIKCTCGSWLDLKSGKFGPYFICINCGNINLNKGLEMMEILSNKTNINNASKKNIEKKDTRKKEIKNKENLYPGFDYGIN